MSDSINFFNYSLNYEMNTVEYQVEPILQINI
jgi:hypothetical protein